jgi:hypothetical protein
MSERMGEDDVKRFILFIVAIVIFIYNATGLGKNVPVDPPIAQIFT